jgi:hypothetical protein
MKTLIHPLLRSLVVLVLLLLVVVRAGGTEPGPTGNSPWYLSVQYLGITFHPGGGTTPEVYPLKFDKKAYLVVNAGLAANLDYSLGKNMFLRFTTTLYKDCAFVSAGGFHLGPRVQYSWEKSRINMGIGPIFSYRKDWHQFEQYTTDDFYGERVSGKWQYRLFPCAVELEYMHRINDHLELQYSLIPGGALVFTSLIGVRFRI